MEGDSCLHRFCNAIADFFSIRCKIVGAIVTFLILTIIALIITVLVLNLRVEHGGASIREIIVNHAIRKGIDRHG